MLSSGIFLRRDARLDKVQIINRPPYSPDLAPSESHLFVKSEVYSGGKTSFQRLREDGAKWPTELAGEVYNTCIPKLAPNYKNASNSTRRPLCRHVLYPCLVYELYRFPESNH